MKSLQEVAPGVVLRELAPARPQRVASIGWSP